MKTTETLAEFVLVGILAFFAVFRVAEVLNLQLMLPSSPATGWLGDFAVFLALSYLAGLIINAVCKELLRPYDRWVRSCELESYASSAKLRALINSLGLGIYDFECVDPLEKISYLERKVLSLTGWPFGPGARRNAKLLKKRYRVVGQLPFAAMKTSSAAHSDINIQRSTVRVSRNSLFILSCAALSLFVVSKWQGKPLPLMDVVLFGAGAIGSFFSFRQRARWYAVDSIKYALTEASVPQPKAPRAVLMDQGGVLTGDIREPLFRALAKKWRGLRVTLAKVDPILWREASTSQMSYERFWERLREELKKESPGFDVSLLKDGELTALAEKEYKLNQAVLKLIEELRELKIPVALVTNNTLFWSERLDSLFHYRSLFDVVTSSFELGMAKPDRRMFEKAMSGLGIKPDALVFIDDREENCLAASRLGIPSVLFRNTLSLRQTLRGFGIPVKEIDAKDKWIGGEEYGQEGQSVSPSGP